MQRKPVLVMLEAMDGPEDEQGVTMMATVSNGTPAAASPTANPVDEQRHTLTTYSLDVNHTQAQFGPLPRNLRNFPGGIESTGLMLAEEFPPANLTPSSRARWSTIRDV